MKDFFKNYVYPISILSGSIIGVGFLSLPYIAVQVGIGWMVLYFVCLTALVVFLHSIFATIALKTPDFKRFPGFVEFYLGKRLKIVALVMTMFGSIGVLLIYLLVGSQFLASMFGGEPWLWAIGYFLVLSLVVGFGVRLVSKIEFWALVLLLVSLVLVFVQGFFTINLSHFSLPPVSHDPKTLFLPYGAIIFSLCGVGLIPDVEELLSGKKRLLRRVVVIGTLIPALFYLLFIFLVVGISGSATTESALVGLKLFLNPGIVSIALCMGVITTFTGFVSQGVLLKESLVYDLGMKKWVAWLITCACPLLLLLMGVTSFIPLIAFIGGVFLGINGIFILLMYQKTGGKAIVVYPLLVMFFVGMIYELIFLT